MNEDKKPVVLQKPSGTIAISGNLDALQRKFYNAFLYVAKKSLEQNNNSFQVPLASIKKIFGLEYDFNNKKFRKIILDTMKVILEYNILGKDNIINGFQPALTKVEIVTNQETKKSIINFSLPDIVLKSLMDENSIYASIDLVVIKGLKRKYSIILYEICKDYEKVEIPEISIEQFRKLFGLYDEKTGQVKYPDMPNIRKKVLDPACEELNKNPNVSFKVSYVLTKGVGNVYKTIKFIAKPKPKKLQTLEQTKSFQANAKLKILFDAVPQKYKTKSLESYLSKCLNDYDAHYLLRQIEYTTNHTPKEYFAYLKQAIKENYAHSEKAEIEAELEKKRIQEAIERELENAKEEIEHDVSVRIDNERAKIYHEYMNLLTEDGKQAILEDYLQKAKEKYPDIDEKSFYMEFKIQQLITEDIIAKNEIYQKRLEKVKEQAIQMSEKEFERIKYSVLIKYGQVELTIP